MNERYTPLADWRDWDDMPVDWATALYLTAEAAKDGKVVAVDGAGLVRYVEPSVMTVDKP